MLSRCRRVRCAPLPGGDQPDRQQLSSAVVLFSPGCWVWVFGDNLFVGRVVSLVGLIGVAVEIFLCVRILSGGRGGRRLFRLQGGIDLSSASVALNDDPCWGIERPFDLPVERSHNTIRAKHRRPAQRRDHWEASLTQPARSRPILIARAPHRCRKIILEAMMEAPRVQKPRAVFPVTQHRV